MKRKDIISRLRNALKEVHADSEYSNRYLWNIILTNAKTLIKEDAVKGQTFKQDSIWESICVEMEPVSSLICNCKFLKYDCQVFRSKTKIPEFFESSDGIIYRFIATPDLSQELTIISPYQYSIKSKIKYNREKYAFIHDGYLYTPSLEYPLYSLSALFIEDVSCMKCEDSYADPNLDSDIIPCADKLEINLPLPDYLETTCIKMSLEELGFSKQTPSDQIPNANENQKETNI